MTESCGTDLVLSQEQELFIQKVQEGYNVLVDACIGSGKTTAIQHLCNVLPTNLNILYLTYNKLLKLDARSKIKNKNVTVTNYHGFAFTALRKIGISVGIPELIQSFIREKPPIDHYDVLVIDEYQDIEQELAELLEIIKHSNSSMQIVAVGDMEQKIYDKTTLAVPEFIDKFLGDNYVKLKFTKCFRLQPELASRLGHIWGKTIVGVNGNNIVEEMTIDQVVDFLAGQDPKDILCLGSRNWQMPAILNALETNFPDKFNKKTVFASISDKDATGSTEPKKTSAIFTTYDSSKGLERKICVICDFTESYWQIRIKNPMQSYEILRNIFCVAASRGKERIIFIKDGEPVLSDETLSTNTEMNTKFENVNISGMFDFKYIENIEECYSLLNIKPLESDDFSIIDIKNSDELIDLSPCIGIYQEAVFFNGYNIDHSIEFYINFKKNMVYTDDVKNQSLDKKILFLARLETKQSRYYDQVTTPFVKDNEKELLTKRLGTVFSPDEKVQVRCNIDFANENQTRLFSAIGLADVVKDDIVYELKFVSELTHEHFLQCACYIVALGLNKGILWNTRNNEMFEITIPDKNKFLDAVVNTVTKNVHKKYYTPTAEQNISDKIAVIDTETNWDNRVMSLGAVIADKKTFQPIDSKYYIFDPEYKFGGMYSSALNCGNGVKTILTDRKAGIANLSDWLKNNNVNSLFAYNANFDLNNLPELNDFSWYDIMKIAAYRQYNAKIPPEECYQTGRMKRNYGVESMIRLVAGDNGYHETHNALKDAQDELRLMKLLGVDLKEYSHAKLVKNTSHAKNAQSTAVQLASQLTTRPDVQTKISAKNLPLSKHDGETNSAKPSIQKNDKSESTETDSLVQHKSCSSNQIINVGDRVLSRSFGVGTVIKKISLGKLSLYKISFDGFGERYLTEVFAKLKKL